MPAFKNGVHVNSLNGKMRYLRVSAGPQRGKYVHLLVLAAKLGRPIREGYTGEHVDGNTMNNDPDNLIEVTAPENTKLMWMRRKAAKEKAAAKKAKAASA